MRDVRGDVTDLIAAIRGEPQTAARSRSLNNAIRTNRAWSGDFRNRSGGRDKPDRLVSIVGEPDVAILTRNDTVELTVSGEMRRDAGNIRRLHAGRRDRNDRVVAVTRARSAVAADLRCVPHVSVGTGGDSVRVASRADRVRNRIGCQRRRRGANVAVVTFSGETLVAVEPI